MDSIPQILQRLNDHGVNFVVIGGVAAILHGSVRTTLDVDVCAPLDEPNLGKILSALRGTDPRWRMHPKRPALTDDVESLKGFKALYLDTDIGIVDVITEVTGVGGFDEVARHAIPVDAGSVECQVLDLDTLIVAKRAVGRRKDLDAVIELEVIRQHLARRQDP